MRDEFASWLHASCEQLGYDFDDLITRRVSGIDWFRKTYDALGAISPIRLRLLEEEARERSAKIAFEIVKREVEFYHKEMLDVSIEEGISEWAEGSRGFYFLDAELCWLTVESAIVDIGDTVQAEIMERDREVWPTPRI